MYDKALIDFSQISYLNIPWLGVFALCFFVGFLLSRGLSTSGDSLKAVITALGAALGGGPILFLKDAGNLKGLYPIGLI